jgi:hypothetical protein
MVTVGSLDGWTLNTSGSFYYPAKAYNQEVAASYIVYRIGKIDTRFMDTLYGGTFTASVTANTAVVAAGVTATMTTTNI